MPTKRTDKAIVTNFHVLNEKYGSTGVERIRSAIRNLVDQDQKRALATQLFGLDSAESMQHFNAPAVNNAADQKQNKDAVDAICKAINPDYLMILGAPDVIPHQDLTNPCYSSRDWDRYASGDLPYACEAGYSRNPGDFCGPTRVVGRLPDLTGARNPQYLLDLLNNATAYSKRDPQSYRSYFGICAEKWKNPTQLSITNIFGSVKELKTIPPANPRWPLSLLNRLSHFINCHGSLNDSHFYGQPVGVEDYPIALSAEYLNNKIAEGTIVAAECCYGGQLFDPALNGDEPGIVNSYLINKAYCFFGSTTIAYGMVEAGNAAADLICQYFMKKLLQGASAGRAALDARQEFAQDPSRGEPINLKTLAQFNLYADPSITPIDFPETDVLSSHESMRAKRLERRRNLTACGLALAKTQPKTIRIGRKDAEAKIPLLKKISEEHGIDPGPVLAFRIKQPGTGLPSRVYLVFDRGEGNLKNLILGPITVLVVKEMDDKIISVTKLVSR